LGFNWRRRILTIHPGRVTWRKENSSKILGEFIFGSDTKVISPKELLFSRGYCLKPNSFCIASVEQASKNGALQLHLQCANEEEVEIHAAFLAPYFSGIYFLRPFLSLVSVHVCSCVGLHVSLLVHV
jgi:hypothetical protein